MKTKTAFGCVLLFLCLLSVVYPYIGAGGLSATTPLRFQLDKLTIQTVGGERHFTVEIAETREQQERGLMFRKMLPHDHGMLFVWNKDTPISMWMKNTLIPLDMLFIDSHGRIVHIAENAVPESTVIISSGQPIRAVIELAGGTAVLDGIKVGDTVIHSHFKP